MTDYNYCVGCRDFSADQVAAMCSEYNKDGNCPCTNCIVKTMCVASSSCDDLGDWYIKSAGETKYDKNQPL